jgi:ADP-ribosylglycohydrolase
MTLILDKYIGTMLGAAVGDALGAPVEFMSRKQIREAYSNGGIETFDGPGLVTDDTQMMLYTAAAAVKWKGDRNANRRQKSKTTLLDCLRLGYREWHHAQSRGLIPPEVCFYPEVSSAVHRQGARAPGATCIEATSGPRSGTMLEPINNSKGCGGVMRVAPLGLLGPTGPDPFVIGCESAALTHGHPGAIYPAGAMAMLVHELVENDVPNMSNIIRRLDPITAAEQTLFFLARAAGKVEHDGLIWNPEDIGGGWVGDEALAIGLAAFLGADPKNPFDALRWAVNHGGDSDTTGCIAGALLGASYGLEAIPAHLADAVEDKGLIIDLATKLYAATR